MGGKLRDGYCVIGGVVTEGTREFFDELVAQKLFASRSEAIGHVLSQYAGENGCNGKNDDGEA